MVINKENVLLPENQIVSFLSKGDGYFFLDKVNGELFICWIQQKDGLVPYVLHCIETEEKRENL